MGINIDKEFMPSVANTIGTDMSNYQIVKMEQFACNPMHLGRDERMPTALLLNKDEILVSPAYFVFEIIDKNVILPEYLMLYFKQPETDRLLWFKTDSSVRGGLGWNELCDIEIPVPDIERQKDIIRQYNQISDAIKIKEKLNNNLEQQCLTNYIKLLDGYTIESDSLPDGWRIGCIGDYSDVKSGYAFKSNWWTNSGYKVIKIANITNNSINLDSCDCVIEENALKAKDFRAVPGDIMIAMTGATTGKVGIVPACDDNIVVNQRVGKFFLGKNPIEKAPFLFSTLIYDRVAYYLQPNGTAGSAQDNLSPDDIKRISIVLPKDELVENYNNKFKNLIKVIINNCAEIRALKKINNILLSKYFTAENSDSSTAKLSFSVHFII